DENPELLEDACVRRGRACVGCALAEVRFEPPEVVEMLARPEQHECGPDRCLVAAAGGVADAREQTAAALGVADVRRWHRTAVHECVPERDVPRLKSMDLAVEVLAAGLEAR